MYLYMCMYFCIMFGLPCAYRSIRTPYQIGQTEYDSGSAVVQCIGGPQQSPSPTKRLQVHSHLL